MFRLKMLCRVFLLFMILSFSGPLISEVSDTLKFSGDVNYPPFSFINSNGNPDGFTVDLLREVSSMCGFSYELRLEQWNDAYKHLESNKVDAVIGMLRSKNRMGEFLFSTPHSYLSHVIISRPDRKITSLSQIHSAKVLVLQKDVMDQYFSESGIAKNILTVSTFDELFTDFNEGKADLVVVSQIHAYHFYKTFNLQQYNISPIHLDPFPFCFAVQPDNLKLQAQINEALFIMHKSGKYDEYYDKWFAAEKHETMPQFLSEWWKYLAIVLIIIAIGFIVWNSTLSRKVSSQNDQLKSELNAKTIAEKQLRTVVERLTIAQRSAGIGIWELNLKNMELYWDQGMFTLYERDIQAFNATYDDWIASLHPDDQELSVQQFEGCIKNNEDFAAVFRISTPSGKQKHIRAFAKLTYDKNGSPIKAVGVNWDVSKAAEDAIVNDVLHAISQSAVFSENLVGFMEKIRLELSRVVDTTNFFIGLIEEETGKLYLPYMKDNVEEFKYFPIKNSISSYIIEQKKSMLFYAEDLEELHKKGIIERAGGQAKVWLGVPLQIENQIIGLIVLQSYTNKNAITLEHAKLLEYIAPQLSLSIKRKKIQDELVSSEEALRKITEQLKEAQVIAQMGNFEWDEKTQIFTFSDEIYNIFGIEKQGDNSDFEAFKALIHTDDCKDLIELIKEASINHTVIETECRLFNKISGEPRIIAIKGQPAMKNGKYLGYFSGILQDITDQKDIEYELMAAKVKAEQSDKLKSAFLANMSHEIRTPMNSIIGFSQILTEAEDVEELEKYTHIITKSGEHLLNLIDDIIDISKIEAGLLKVEKHIIDLDALCETTLFQFNENDKVKNGAVELRLVKPENEIGFINTDQTKLKQVLINLIYNALKFTKSGFIELRYKTTKNDSVLFEVEDTGIGIPKDKLKDIFDRFMQVNMNEVSKSSGAGLGLSLCKSYVKLIGGEIWVKSTEGDGSTFSFEIPYEPAEINLPEVNHPIESISPLKSKPTILIAEDDDDSFLFFETIMQKSGFNFIHVNNGEEAVDRAKTDTSIDLVMMDVRMPVMDGLSATRIIKSFRPDLPVIAQTAHAMDGDRQKAMEAGCDDYIPKPVKRDVLLDKINKLLMIAKDQEINS